MPNFSHILVNHEYEAEDILRLLKQGKSFEELASRFSKCSSSIVGGKLGNIPLARTHEDFEAAAKSLKPGEHTLKPIRTPVGYHIILRHDEA